MQLGHFLPGTCISEYQISIRYIKICKGIDQTIIFVGGIGNGIRTYRTLSYTGHANGQGTGLCDERACAGVAFEGGAGSERWELFDAETTKSLFTLSVVGHGGGVGGGSEEV